MMKYLAVYFFLIWCLCPISAKAQCDVAFTTSCEDFANFLGYEEGSCNDFPCDEGWGGWECNTTEQGINILGNSADYYETAAPGVAGNTMLEWTTGDACIRKRPCEDCQVQLGDERPNCLFKAGSVWSPFIWGSVVSYVGDPCVGS